MNSMELGHYEDAILTLIDERDDYTRSDLQGMVGALVRKIVAAAQSEEEVGVITTRTFNFYDVMPGDERDAVKAAIASFPISFGLRAYPGKTFRLGVRESFVSDGVVKLYTQVMTPISPAHPSGWMDFAKGTVSELLAEVVAL